MEWPLRKCAVTHTSYVRPYNGVIRTISFIEVSSLVRVRRCVMREPI